MQNTMLDDMERYTSREPRTHHESFVEFEERLSNRFLEEVTYSREKIIPQLAHWIINVLGTGH